MFVRRGRPRSWWYPWIFVGGFVVVFLANMALLFFATLTFNGLETPEASDKRNAYSDAIRAAELQDRLGWEGHLTSVLYRLQPMTRGRRARIGFHFLDRDGHVLENLAVRAEFRRPGQDELDFFVSFPSVGSGRYAADVDFPVRGCGGPRICDAEYRCVENGQTYRRSLGFCQKGVAGVLS